MLGARWAVRSPGVPSVTEVLKLKARVDDLLSEGSRIINSPVPPSPAPRSTRRKVSRSPSTDGRAALPRVYADAPEGDGSQIRQGRRVCRGRGEKNSARGVTKLTAGRSIGAAGKYSAL